MSIFEEYRPFNTFNLICEMLTKGDSCNKNRMANHVDPDETASLFAKVFVVVYKANFVFFFLQESSFDIWTFL